MNSFGTRFLLCIIPIIGFLVIGAAPQIHGLRCDRLRDRVSRDFIVWLRTLDLDSAAEAEQEFRDDPQAYFDSICNGDVLLEGDDDEPNVRRCREWIQKCEARPKP